MHTSDLDFIYETLALVHDALPNDRQALRIRVLDAKITVFEEMKAVEKHDNSSDLKQKEESL